MRKRKHWEVNEPAQGQTAAGISANQPVSKAYTLSHYTLFSQGVYVFVL